MVGILELSQLDLVTWRRSIFICYTSLTNIQCINTSSTNLSALKLSISRISWCLGFHLGIINVHEYNFISGNYIYNQINNLIIFLVYIYS